MAFDIEMYSGDWYEIMSYPSWFSPSNSFNTTAKYTITDEGLRIHNSTIDINGVNLRASGTGTVTDKSFDDGTEPIASLSVVFDQYPTSMSYYLIDNIFMNDSGQYSYSIVSNPSRSQLFVLSRRPHVPLDTILFLTQYLKNNYDTSKIINVPHYMI